MVFATNFFIFKILRDRLNIAVLLLVFFFGIFGFTAFVQADTQPIGYFDGVTEGELWGWAYDVDAGNVPLKIHIYVDGVPTISLTADQLRPDLVAAGVAPEADHGFLWEGFSLDPGTHIIEVFAINDPPGNNPSLGKKTFTVGTSGGSVDKEVARLPEAKDIITLETNLVGLWHFDEEYWQRVPGEIRDASGMDNHGVARNGATTTLLGKMNRSANFDGKDDFITMGDVAVLDNNGMQPMTWSAWLKFGGGVTNKVILSKYNTTSGKNIGYQLWHDKPSRLEFSIGTTLTNRIQVRGSTTLADNRWHQVVVTYDGSGDASGVQLYVDGQIENQTIVYNRLAGSASTTSAFNVGARNNGDDRITGTIDEVAVWRRVLSVDEVADLYEQVTFDIESQSVEVSVMAAVFHAFSSFGRWFFGLF